MLIEAGFLLKSEVISRDWGDGIVPVNVSEDDAVNEDSEPTEMEILVTKDMSVMKRL